MASRFNHSDAEDFIDFFESSLSGFVIADADGNITRINKRVASWLNTVPEKLLGQRFSNILTVGGRIYFETHLWPLLRLQGHFDEIALELADSGSGKLPVYINGDEKRDEHEKVLLIRFNIFRASDRRLYEENLQIAKKLAQAELKLEQQNALIREQFIAVLGHDLRNPLSGIMNAAQLLARKNIGQSEKRLVDIIESGSRRMHEMINDIMDLARGRLGGGFNISPVKSDLEKLLNQISDELMLAWPERIIVMDFNINGLVECDPGRLAQLVSNLLGNAITHGAADMPVVLHAITANDFWEISVINKGNPIPDGALKHLFHPFRREGKKASKNGLGLGLYIASEIAKAHHGSLTVKSDVEQTCFTLRIPVLLKSSIYLQ